MNEIMVGLSNQLIALKIWLHENLGVHDDALHVHFSLLLLFAAALILRKRADSIWCWMVVFVIEMINEYADLTGQAAGEGTLQAAWEDLYTTMFWPTVILLFGRFLFPPRGELQAEEPANHSHLQSGDLANQSFEKPPAI